MRTLTSISAVLLCTILWPWHLKAQDSQVTTSDNSGNIENQGKKGKVKIMSHKSPRIVAYAFNHGIAQVTYSRFVVNEQNYIPICLQVVADNQKQCVVNLTQQGGNPVAAWNLDFNDGLTIEWVDGTTFPGSNSVIAISMNPISDNIHFNQGSKQVSDTANNISQVQITLTTTSAGQPVVADPSPLALGTYTIHYCNPQTDRNCTFAQFCQAALQNPPACK